MSDPFNHLGSIWDHSEPQEVPFCPNQFLGLDFFCRFLQQTGSNHSYFLFFSVLSWADVPNWPQLTNQLNSGNNHENDQTSRSDTISDNLIGKYPMFNPII